MKTIFSAVRLTLISMVLFAVIYPLVITGFAQLAPHKGKGETVTVNGKTVGYKLLGQSFTADKYFWSRPSAVAYNSAGSGGSNKGATNAEYLATVQSRIDTFMVHNPEVPKAAITAEMVTASGSGLDPDISPESARIQVKRIAAARHIGEDKILALIQSKTQKPLLGLFGPEAVNVLALNVALDELK
ncbi:K(+)-transporting ATPase subunit C [Emticicia sp. TH156]|uniref:K(+)-transporting ATPase subunit C n=1 Tax=Emticicia sp. TH156 TaxID=2067454 RepID=UPI000C75F705|nr:K(+)-transporting ATPase subunit C [Emticicia sp. TH156]PLK44842.1 potassium-transporting ATPase subunit C [Emticicia sp. TH156]